MHPSFTGYILKFLLSLPHMSQANSLVIAIAVQPYVSLESLTFNETMTSDR